MTNPAGLTDALEQGCLNCGAPLVGPYCSACGQKDPKPDVTLREFVHDTTHELTELDGKVPRTLKATRGSTERGAAADAEPASKEAATKAAETLRNNPRPAIPISLGRHLNLVPNVVCTRMDETQVIGARLRLIRPIFEASGVCAATAAGRWT